MVQKDVWNHFKRHSLDTIIYLKDPQDNAKALLVVLDHPNFRADAIKFQSLANNEFRDRFDMFDASNDEAAQDFLDKVLIKAVLPSEKEGKTSVDMDVVPKDSPRGPAPNAKSLLKPAEAVVVQSLMAIMIVEEAVVGRPRLLLQANQNPRMSRDAPFIGVPNVSAGLPPIVQLLMSPRLQVHHTSKVVVVVVVVVAQQLMP